MRTAAAVALLSECRTRVLVLEYDGLFQIPGGKSEFGETPEDTARREFEEETGLRLGRLTELHRFSSDRFDIVRYVATEYFGTPRSSEEGQVTWRAVKLLSSRAKYPEADAKLVELLAKGGWTR